MVALLKSSWLGSSAKKALLFLALLFTLAVFGACGTEESAPGDEENVDVGIGTGAEPTAPAPLEVLAQLDGHFDGKSLTFTPVREDGALRTQNYDTYGKVALDFSETGPLTFTTTEAIVNNNQGPGCTAAARDYPTTNFADGQNHFLKDSAFSSTACTNGHLCAIVTITNTATNYFDRVYTEVSQFKPSGVRGDNGLQPYNSASNTTGYPKGFGLGVKDGGVDGANDGIWWYDSIAPSSTSKKVRWDFALPSCADFNFLTTVRGSKRVTKYAVTTTTQPFQDACVSGTALLFSSGNALDVPVPFPLTIYDKPIASLTVGTYGYLHEGQERTASVTESFAASNSDFPLDTKMPWAVVPYWGTVAASQVCTATTGTAPNRSFVVTWKYTSADNFVSAILHETTDQVEFQYGGSARCSSSTSNYRGKVSTVGIQGSGNTYKRVNYNNDKFLSSTGCPASGTAPNGVSVPTVRLTANGTQSGTGLPPNDPFSGGNTNTNLKIVTSSDYAFANSNLQVCVNLSVTGTTSTPAPWELRVDLSLPPFNGLSSSALQSQGQNQVNVDDAGGGFARVYGKTNSGNPWNADWNNALLTSSQTLDKIKLCSYNTPQAIAASTDPSWYTLTYTNGEWTATKACVTVTAKATVDPTYFPFDFVWQATLDITAAKNKITSSGKTLNYVSWIPSTGSGYWTSTPTNYNNPLPNSYAIVSSQNGGNNGNLNTNNFKTQTVTACVHSN